MATTPAAFPVIAAPHPRGSVRSCDVLVVGDEPAYRSCLADYLRHAGYAVEDAPNGHMAVRFLAEHRPRMVLVDVFMPEVDGFDVMRLALRMQPPPPVLVMSDKTAFALGWFARLTELLGAGRTLVKPFPLVELLIAVQAAVGAPR
jgi:DNA-binding response OmpR family regulator